MNIVLLRHGMPKIEKTLRMSAREFGLWVSAYNAAGIDNSSWPPPDAIQQANQCAVVVCSDLPRSLESAQALGVTDIHLCEPIFREMEMPYAKLAFPRLSPGLWSVLFRLAWLAGYSANAESFKEARKRARDCAKRLVELASRHGTVLLVGHGSLNWFIARYLAKWGWSAAGKPPRKYWQYGVYRYRPK